MLDGKLLIVTSAPGGRDTIYIGFAKATETQSYGPFLTLTQASMILRYEEVGVPGLASQPEKAVRLRPVSYGEGEVVLPFSSISAMIVADPEKWKSFLRRSVG